MDYIWVTKGYIGVILGYGKENGSYYNGVSKGLGFYGFCV